VFGKSLIGLLTGIDAVRERAADFLPWAAVSPLLGVWSYLFDGIFVGTTHTAEMRNGMIISLAAYLLAVWLLLPVWGNHGLWMALMIFLVARALTLGAWYPRIERSLHDAA
jgi:MATE family multidrug resistance protein